MSGSRKSMCKASGVAEGIVPFAVGLAAFSNLFSSHFLQAGRRLLMGKIELGPWFLGQKLGKHGHKEGGIGRLALERES
jgi:hypothetical protein